MNRVGKVYYRNINSSESIEIINSYKNNIYYRDLIGIDINILYINDDITENEFNYVHTKNNYIIKYINDIDNEIKIKVIRLLFNINKIYLGVNNV